MVLISLFMAFVRVGVLGFGGGPSSIPLVEMEAVDNYHWMTTEEFAEALALGNALPGPIATKMAGYIGYKVAGIVGATSAVLGVVLPSLIAMLLLYRLISQFKDLPQIKGLIRAMKPVVVILLLQLVIDLFPKSFVSYATWGVALVSFVALVLLKVHPAIVVVAALTFGAVFKI